LIIPRSDPREEQLIRARIFADKGLLEYIPWETVDADGMHEKIRLLLKNTLDYEEQLRKFPMTAFDVINSRIRTFGAPK
jgi:predicted glycosyltransferase